MSCNLYVVAYQFQQVLFCFSILWFFSSQDTHVICKHSFISSFPMCTPCIFFKSYCINQDFSHNLNKNGEKDYPCLILIFKGKASNFSPLSMMLAIGCSQVFFIKLRKFSSVPSRLRVFIMNGCLILSNAFSVSIKFMILLLQPVDVIDYID